MAERNFAAPGTSAWVINTALINVLREEGILTEDAFARLIGRVRSTADRYEAGGYPADAGELRRDADEMEAMPHPKASASQP